MLEQLLIFTRGGLILWTCNHLSNALRGSPIDTLIRSCLLEERSGAASFNYDAPGAAYSLKWTFHNDLGLVFVAVYQRVLHLLYVDDLLAAVKREFSRLYHPQKTAYRDFDEIFQQLQIEAESRSENFKKPNPVPALAPNRKQNGTWQGQGLGQNAGSEKKSDGDGKKGRKLENDNFSVANSNSNANVNHSGGKSSVNNNIGKENESSNVGAFDVNRLQKLKGKKGNGNGKKKDALVVAAAKGEPKKVDKPNRVWDQPAPQTKLDFTDHVDGDGDRSADFLAKEQGESMMDKEEILSSDSEVEDDDDDTGKDNMPVAKKKGWFSSMFQR